MKSVLAIIILFAGIAANAQEQPKKSAADVEQYSGCYIFYMCKPVREYDYLGTMKLSGVANTTKEAAAKYAAAAKKEYPEANGIIFNKLDNGFGKDIFDVIKFKD